jgi:hypothetical protein
VERISRLEETAIMKIIAFDLGHAPRNSINQPVADMAYKFGNKDMHKGKPVGIREPLVLMISSGT